MTQTDKAALTGRLSGVGLVTPALAEGQARQMDTVRDIETITGEILEAQRAGGEAILTIGRGLIEAKAMLDHGQWLPWLADKVGYSERTAQAFMRLARKYENPQLVADLGMRKALALLALPDSEREAFAAENNVIDMTSRELERAIRERDEARKAAEQAQADARSAAEARVSMEENLKTANELLERAKLEKEQAAGAVSALEKELAELKAAPVEVAVEVDTAAIEAAREETRSKVEAEFKLARKEAQRQVLAANEAAAQAKTELAQAQREIENLKFEVKRAVTPSPLAADADLAQFNLLFDLVQRIVNQMRRIFLKVRGREDPTTAEKLSKAISALADQMRRCAE